MIDIWMFRILIIRKDRKVINLIFLFVVNESHNIIKIVSIIISIFKTRTSIVVA